MSAVLNRTAMVGVYLPALLFEVGVGAITPMIAVRAVQLGASLATAGVLAALMGIGRILADVPAGALAARLGDRRAMLVAAGVAAVTLTACALASSVPLLAVGVLATGSAEAVFGLARQSYLTEVTPVLLRARALSTLGGAARIGLFVGPFLGAAVVHLTSTSGAFGLAVVTTASTAVVVALTRDPDVPSSAPRPGSAPRRVLREHTAVFAQVGSAIVLVGLVRGARVVALPLWSQHLGLAPATTSLIFALSGALDSLLFLPGGRLMDARGRLAVAVPSMLLLGVALLLVPLTRGAGSLVAVAALLGAANGVGAGVVMTLAADLAPPEARAPFLGVWRLLADVGMAGGPLLVSAGAAAGSLAGGLVVTGVLGFVSAGALRLTVPRWTVHASVRTRVAAGLRRDGRPVVGTDEARAEPPPADGSA